MTRTLDGEVLHVVPPEELDDYDIEDELQSMAESRYILVCRAGGKPSWLERVRSFFTRRPIEATTLVSETGADEGDEVTATVHETDLPGVYEATDLRT
ncbi:DUF7526 family protein [Haloglomus salinum]|jgi:hypothetical protein|uniref:DUF7526 family protein n=1 Tax=Haloglomus salinum TaxID=2962673 RepID=UPI0020CA0871|nr:hypothetical protein [Haloglomus salinum]